MPSEPNIPNGVDRMPSALVFYHYFHPDDVVSAIHLSELCEELFQRGWTVTARPCNRACRHGGEDYPLRGRWKGVRIRRIWRPAFPQSSTLGRLANAGWMIGQWGLEALRNAPDFIIIGTDPVLSVALASIWKLIRPRTRVAHWCFDLYPEAAIADGMLSDSSLFVKLLRPGLRRAYQSCDLLVDLGSCMRKRLERYQSNASQVTLTPWALYEPASALPVDEDERRKIFGDAALALLYSGSFGRAHSAGLVLELARRLEPRGARLAFSIQGNRAAELSEQARGISNVSFVPFAPYADLHERLSAADIHVVSLHESWTGAVVPSKFFGALAAGRPVLFAGSFESSIANWITQHKVGWVLTEATLDSVANQLSQCCRNPGHMPGLFAHCHAVYQRHFSKAMIADEWDRKLRGLLGEDPVGAVARSDATYAGAINR